MVRCGASAASATGARASADATRRMFPARRAASSAGSTSAASTTGGATTGRCSDLTDGDRLDALARLPDRIAFLGLGLIGGSIALALRDAGSRAHLVAWTPDGVGPAAAFRRGAIDAAPATATDAVEGAGLVVLAGPPLATLAAVDGRVAETWSALAPGAVITDVASTKWLIGSAAAAAGLPFVGGHPMAGRETSGFDAASADLFVDRPWVVVPSPASPVHGVELVEALAEAVGARPVRMTAEAHDVAVGAISHLPLVAAAALVEAVAGDQAGWAAAGSLAASGWRDMTRLARGDAEMGAGILATNAGAVAAWLRAYRDAIDGWLRELEAPGDPATDPAADPDQHAHDIHAARLRARLAAARAALRGDPPP